jgi:hypothetical protein
VADSPIRALPAGTPADAAVADAVASWEPHLRLDPPGAQPVLYEPEGPIYAVLLGPACTLATDRRRVAVAPLDLVVVSPGLAIDVEPAASFLALRHLGPPPPHFRERFVQVWGFEHRPAGAGPSRLVVDPDAAGHRLRHEVLDLGAGPTVVTLPPFARGLLAVPDEGREVVAAAGPHEVRLAPGSIAILQPGTPLSLRGPARVGLVTALPEGLHEARALERLRAGRVDRVDYPAPAGPAPRGIPGD